MSFEHSTKALVSLKRLKPTFSRMLIKYWYLHSYRSFAYKYISSISGWSSIKFKGAATDMRYFARSEFSRSLVHKKNFTLIWQVVFGLGYVFCQERWDTSFEFEWTRRKVGRDNNSRQIYKQAIIKLLLAYSFRKIFFIGQNLKHVHMT